MTLSSQTIQTRGRIVKAALHLFNDKGYSNVTTHQIAHAADLSPGNLYYHYRNKDEILREIFAQMDILSKSSWQDRGPSNEKGSFIEFSQFFFGGLERYRFFFREFPLIVKTVPVMASLWRERWHDLMNVMRQAAKLWVKAGMLKKFEDDEAVDTFIESCWILANFSTVHFELVAGDGQVVSKKKSLQLLVRFLYAYHTPKGQRALDLYLK